MPDAIPYRGTLTIDGKLAESDYPFAVRPEPGDMEWRRDGKPLVVHVQKVEPYKDGLKQRFRVYAVSAA